MNKTSKELPRNSRERNVIHRPEFLKSKEEKRINRELAQIQAEDDMNAEERQLIRDMLDELKILLKSGRRPSHLPTFCVSRAGDYHVTRRDAPYSSQ